MREKFSAVLLSVGLILAFLPQGANRSLIVKPDKLLTEVLDESNSFTADQVARFIITEDSTVQIIDVRHEDEFKALNLPGSMNLPYEKFLEKDPGIYLNKGNLKTIFYSNGDRDAGYALTIARGLRYKNTFVMKGGLNEWYKTVMNSSFSGERISARENALFETRSRARKLFAELNSLPDSLKARHRESAHLTAKKLDGGCE